MAEGSAMILLDTCVLLWINYDLSKLSASAIQTIENTSERYVSSISALEISLKVRDKKIALPLPFDEWWQFVKHHHQLQEIEVDSNIAFVSGQLNLVHKDPFDRMLIATAMLKDLSFITPDDLIHQYPGLHWVW